MKILVTGATGFVGRHVVNELLKHDHEIIGTTRDQNLNISNNNVRYTFLDLDNLDPSIKLFFLLR